MVANEEIVLRELIGLDEIATIFPIFRQANHLSEDVFLARLTTMIAQGNYRCVAAFVDGRMVGASGFWTGTQLWCGKYVEADNVTVDAALRGKGIGALMMAWIEAEGERTECAILRVATVLSNTDAQRFYKRCGFFDDGLLMVKALARGAADFPEYVQPASPS